VTPNRRPTIPPTHAENRKSIESLNSGMLELQGFMTEPQRAVRLGELLDAGIMEMTPTGVAQRKDSLYVLKAGDQMPGWLAIGSTVVADRPLVVWSTTNPLAAQFGSVLVVGKDNKERFEARSCNTGSGGFMGKSAGGTDINTPTATPSGTTVAIFGGSGFDGSAWIAGSRSSWRFNATQLWTSTAQGTRATLATTANGSTTQVDRMEMRAGGMARFVETADLTTDLPGALKSIEIFYRTDGSFDLGTINSFDRGAGVYKDLNIAADITNILHLGASRFRVDSNGMLMLAGHIRSNVMHNNATSPSGASVQYVASGTYTPTLTNGTNVDSSVSTVCQWMRVGNVVTVSGRVDVDATAAASTLTFLGISLPLASDFTLSGHLSGGGASGTIMEPLMIAADTTNNRATMSFLSLSTASRAFQFHFTYLIL
jgi:hypothetical protein